MHWLGWQSDLSEFYAGIDVLLFNSDWDAFGLTPVEAMSYGRPVVASVVNGGLKEAIIDDRVGILLGAHKPASLADAVLRALSPEGAGIGLNARKRVAAMSDPEQIAEEVEHLLKGDVNCLDLFQ